MKKVITRDDIALLAGNFVASISQSEQPNPPRIILLNKDLEEMIAFGDLTNTLANLLDESFPSHVDVVERRFYLPCVGDYIISVEEIFGNGYVEHFLQNPSCGLMPEDYRMRAMESSRSSHDLSGE